MEGLFANKILGSVSFGKKSKEVGALKQKEGRAGVLHKSASFFLPPMTGNIGKEGRSPAVPVRRPWATVADGRRGKRGREVRGFDPPLSISGEKARREGSHGGGQRPYLAGVVAAL